MKATSGLLAFAVLSACSGGGDQKGADASNVAAPPVTGAPSSATSNSGGLTAAVSDLRADTSGLNVRETAFGTVVELPADTLFEFDKADLSPDAATNLAKVAELIRSAPAGPIKIVGHTDAKGDDAYNQRLSEQRAAAVADWMKEQVGVRQRTFDVAGKGETEPVAANQKPDGSDDPDGRARNRRVEIVIPKAG